MPLEAIPRSLELYQKEDGSIPYLDWIETLRDRRTVDRVNQRVRRLELGNFGDFKHVGEDVNELRLFFGKGYRIYFEKHGASIIVILKGGDKDSQKKDIKQAKQYWVDYKERTL